MNKTENERIRQTCVTHEAMQAVLDELEQVKRERDAAIFDLGECTRIKYSPNCSACKHDGKTCFESPCSECSKNHSKFEWRGLSAENSANESSGEVKRIKAENETLRNELCSKCGLYKTDGCAWCRWKRKEV